MSGPARDLSKIITEVAEQEQVESITTSAELEPDFELDLEEHKLEFRVACLQHDFLELQANHLLRLSYTSRIYWMVIGWLACVVACIGFSGFGAYGFKLSDAVLIAFLSTTTVNVIGLFVLVAKWMYPTGGLKTASGIELQNKMALMKPAPKKRKPAKSTS